MPNEPRLPHKDVTNLSEIKRRIVDAIAYDPGLKRAINFNGRLAQPVNMLNRNFFIAEVQDQLKVNPNQQASFLTFDLADTFFANLVDERNGDLLLNQFASRILEITMEEDHKPGRNQQVKVCRYGGDEFCIAVVGENIENLVKNLKTSLEFESENSTVSGSYRSSLNPGNVAIINRPISLKKKNERGEVIEVISRSTDPREKQAFDYFFNQGSILTENQIKKALEMDVNFEILTRNTPYLHSDSDEEKLKTIKGFQPDLSSIVIDAMTMSNKDKEEVVSYLERRVFDRLIGGVVQTPAELFRKKEKYKRLVVFDLKFVKELNEIISFQESDELIKQLWKLIEVRLEPFISTQDFRRLYKVDVSRRGGTFSIAFPNNILINQRHINELIADLNLKATVRKQEIEIPIGIATIDTRNELFKQKSERRIGLTKDNFDEVNQAAEKDFYKKFVRLLTKERLKKVFLKESYREDHDPFDSLIIEFITGKRSVYRAEKILEYIRSIDGIDYLRDLFMFIERFSRDNMERDNQYDQYSLYKRLKQKIKDL